MIMQENEITPHKKPYEPPQIYRVVLTPDELATTACKSTMIDVNLCDDSGFGRVMYQGS